MTPRYIWWRPINLFATLDKGKQLPIAIDVVQDTVCPWCRIGKKNLDDALANFEGETPEVMYHPFFLHPGMPPAGRAFRDHMRTIKGDDDIGPMLIRVSNAGLQAGLNFNWDKVQRTMLGGLHVYETVPPALPPRSCWRFQIAPQA